LQPAPLAPIPIPTRFLSGFLFPPQEYVMHKFKFRIVAFDETENWDSLPEGAKVWGIYLFCEGEATHCCSLTPSSWCLFLQNIFDGPPTEFQEEREFEGEDFYSVFIDVSKLVWQHRISRPIEFESDEEDEEEARADAWAQAEEYFLANQILPACVG
jgi:hypothetical protein